MYRLIVPVLVVYNGISLATYALLDSGATGSAISSQLVQRLKMNARSEKMTVSTFNYKQTALRQLVDFAIEPIDGSFSLDMKNTLVGEIPQNLTDLPRRRILKTIPFLKGLFISMNWTMLTSVSLYPLVMPGPGRLEKD